MRRNGQPIRILEIVNVMDRAGIETMLMNHYRAIDRSRVQLDFLVHRPWDGAYDEEIRGLGGHIYRAPRLYPQHCLAYRRFMRDFFAEHDYPVIHSHIDAMSAFPLATARAAGVPVRIAHSHNDSIDRDAKYPIKLVARRRLPHVATHFWACSKAAGLFLFGEAHANDLHVVRNAIDLDRFRYDSKARADVRHELGISESTLLIGHVGRFDKVKNHSFLLKLLDEARAEGIDVALTMVGDGALRKSLERQADAAGLGGYAHFLGLRDDVFRLMQAFDILVFPSLHEGIPLTLIEAQASGLPVLASDAVSKESLILPNCSRLSLSEPMTAWVAEMRKLALWGRDKDPVPAIAKAGYEIGESAQALMDSYLSLYEGTGK